MSPKIGLEQPDNHGSPVPGLIGRACVRVVRKQGPLAATFRCSVAGILPYANGDAAVMRRLDTRLCGSQISTRTDLGKGPNHE